MTQKYNIRFAGEITVKSDPVRKKIAKMLRENIVKILKSYNIQAQVIAKWDFIDLEVISVPEGLDVENILEKIFGISHIFKVQQHIFETKEDIGALVKEYFYPILENKKFFVRVKRSGKHDFSSPELERFLGGNILKEVPGVSVSLDNADVLVQLDVKNKEVYIIEKKIQGAGGYPSGFSGKVLSMISGGFDSTVSTYMAMKRGLHVDYLFFDLGFVPQTLGVKQVSYFLWKEHGRAFDARFVRVDFSFLVEGLLEHITPKFRSVLLKRYMLKTTDLLNEYFQKNFSYFKAPYQAIVKGDSIAQVSSQTLANLTTIDTATSLLVLRPLIMFDKQEIIDMSRKIGTFDFAHNMPEYCGVVSDNPSTKATPEQIADEEKKLDEIFYSQIQQKIEVLKIANILDDEKNIDYTGEIVSKIQDGILLDIREPEKIQKNPLQFSGEKQEIPFYKINNEFAKLDQNKKYYLYCEKGTLSKLHAMYLQEKGFQNVSVIRFEK